jgi:hypothetical protein
MSVATASNITPAIASNADNRIITSDGDGTFTAEPNFTFNGTNALLSGSLTVTGSLTVSGSGTLTNIGPARFRSNIANSTTVTAVEITGSSRMSGSLVITGSLRVGVGSDPAIDTTIGTLSNGPHTSVDWVNNYLKDSGTVTSVDWESKRLYNTAGDITVDWDGSVLYDTHAAPSLDWGNRRFAYPNGDRFLDYGTDKRAVLYVSQSLYVSASGLANATASLSIQSEGTVADWYTIALRSRNAVASSSIELNKYITITHGAGGATEFKGDIVNNARPDQGSNYALALNPQLVGN